MTKTELANKMGVTRQAMTDLFKFDNPKASTLIKLSEIFQVSIDDLLLKDLSKEEN